MRLSSMFTSDARSFEFKETTNEAFSNSILKFSDVPRILHKSSINAVFFCGLNCLVLRLASSLDAFSSYP